MINGKKGESPIDVGIVEIPTLVLVFFIIGLFVLVTLGVKTILRPSNPEIDEVNQFSDYSFLFNTIKSSSQNQMLIFDGVINQNSVVQGFDDSFVKGLQDFMVDDSKSFFLKGSSERICLILAIQNKNGNSGRKVFLIFNPSAKQNSNDNMIIDSNRIYTNNLIGSSADQISDHTSSIKGTVIIAESKINTNSIYIGEEMKNIIYYYGKCQLNSVSQGQE